MLQLLLRKPWIQPLPWSPPTPLYYIRPKNVENRLVRECDGIPVFDCPIQMLDCPLFSDVQVLEGDERTDAW